jgi:CheY-like chemotaxis protein
MSSESQRDDVLNTVKTLQILHLEDDPYDRELVRKLMVSEGIACDFTYASSPAEFQTALERTAFDAILADFTLPGYDGMAALAFAQTRCPEVPYLFLSGTIGEQRAIESLKSGATDYVLKDHLKQLGPALRRALREAEERARRKQAEEALRVAEEKYRSIVVNAVEGIFQSAPQGRYLMANPSLARVLGYGSPEELLSSAQNLGHRHLVAAHLHAEFENALAVKGQVQGLRHRPSARMAVTSGFL